jgi:tellurite resistance protein
MRDQGLLWLLRETLNFKSKPPMSDYENYGKALITCANADGKITDEERSFVLGYFDAFGCDSAVLDKLRTYKGGDDMSAIINRSPMLQGTARASVYDAIRACMADGELHTDEKQAIAKMASSLDLTDFDVQELIDVYVEELEVKEKRQRLTYPDGQPY